MVQSPSWEANWFAASQEIHRISRRFITALTSVRHLSLSWVNPIQSTYPHPTFWRSILILSTHLRLGLPSGLFPSGFPTKTLYTPSPHPYAPHAQSISFFSILSPVRDCLFNFFAATLLIGGRSSIRNLRTRHAVMTATHYMAFSINIDKKCSDAYINNDRMKIRVS